MYICLLYNHIILAIILHASFFTAPKGYMMYIVSIYNIHVIDICILYNIYIYVILYIFIYIDCLRPRQLTQFRPVAELSKE